jgi:hypothetical protein
VVVGRHGGLGWLKWVLLLEVCSVWSRWTLLIRDLVMVGVRGQPFFEWKVCFVQRWGEQSIFV